MINRLFRSIRSLAAAVTLGFLGLNTGIAAAPASAEVVTQPEVKKARTSASSPVTTSENSLVDFLKVAGKPSKLKDRLQLWTNFELPSTYKGRAWQNQFLLTLLKKQKANELVAKMMPQNNSMPLIATLKAENKKLQETVTELKVKLSHMQEEVDLNSLLQPVAEQATLLLQKVTDAVGSLQNVSEKIEKKKEFDNIFASQAKLATEEESTSTTNIPRTEMLQTDESTTQNATIHEFFQKYFWLIFTGVAILIPLVFYSGRISVGEVVEKDKKKKIISNKKLMKMKFRSIDSFINFLKKFDSIKTESDLVDFTKITDIIAEAMLHPHNTTTDEGEIRVILNKIDEIDASMCLLVHSLFEKEWEESLQIKGALPLPSPNSIGITPLAA